MGNLKEMKKEFNKPVILCPICATPMDFLEEWNSNLKITKCYECGCSNCGAILKFKDYEKKWTK